MLLTGNLFRDVAWVWALMLAEIAIFFVVVILTYDKNARTHV